MHGADEEEEATAAVRGPRVSVASTQTDSMAGERPHVSAGRRPGAGRDAVRGERPLTVGLSVRPAGGCGWVLRERRARTGSGSSCTSLLGAVRHLPAERR